MIDDVVVREDTLGSKTEKSSGALEANIDMAIHHGYDTIKGARYSWLEGSQYIRNGQTLSNGSASRHQGGVSYENNKEFLTNHKFTGAETFYDIEDLQLTLSGVAVINTDTAFKTNDLVKVLDSETTYGVAKHVTPFNSRGNIKYYHHNRLSRRYNKYEYLYMSLNNNMGNKAATFKSGAPSRKTHATNHRMNGYTKAQLDAKGFYLPQSFMDKIDSEEIMPKYFKSIHLDTNLQFSKDLNQKSFKKDTTILQNLKINDAYFEWGSLNVRAAGGVRLDMDGYPTGKLTIRIKNWEKALDLLIENNSLDQFLLVY
jgi:hypothetical protein